MAFDPDEFISKYGAAKAEAKPAPGGFDPDEFITKFGTPADKKTTAAKAGLSGTVQGISGGFLDEIGGAIRGFAGNRDIRNIGSDYRRERDDLRTTLAKEEKDQPLAFGAGRVVGGIATAAVPGVGIARGAGVGAKALSAARGGAAFGAGSSTADLTKGDVAGAAKDTALGAATGAATSGVLSGVGKVAGAVGNKLGKGAAVRVDERVIGGLTEGGTGKQQAKILGEMGVKKGDLLKVAKETPGLAEAAAAKKTDKTIELVRAAKDKAMGANDAIYKAVDKASEGIKVTDVIGRLEKITNTLAKDPGKRDLARIVEQKTNDVLSSWGERTHVSARELRTFASDIGPEAFRSVPGVNANAAERARRDVYNTLVRTVEQHVDSVASKAGLPAGAGAAIRESNKKISTFINVEAALLRRSGIEATGKKGLGERVVDMVSAGAGGAGLVGSLISGNAAPALMTAGGIAVTKGLPMARRALDRKLANLYRSAQTGDPGLGSALADAIAAGVPRATAEAIVSKFQKRD